MSTSSDFRQSWLWRHAFVHPHGLITVAEQEYFRDRYLSMREKVETLVSQIAPAIPGLTVHDISHLDALWETASLVTEGAMTFSPAEAFVFGASVLLHDSAMSLAAYPKGVEDLQQTIEWKDSVAALLGDADHGPEAVKNPSPDIVNQVIPQVLRQLHAKQAESLATQGWKNNSNDVIHLIDDPELRFFYGQTIGLIAHSHWWSISSVEQKLSENLGAFPSKTRSNIDRVKLACLLRIADALHLDQRRAPRFLRALVNPKDSSALHWTFQERMAFPQIEHESVIFSSCVPFGVDEAEAWWLAFDTIRAVDRELQDVDLLMQNRSQGLFFGARRVKGAGNPESLSRTLQARGWRPVDTQFRVSDLPKLVETLGGAKLYGDDPTIVLRELIQNGADAIQARRRFQKRRKDWGNITVSISSKPDGHWLIIEDNGIGMSERVLTGPLIDFGTSFWRSTLATQEFPGLISDGMNAIGRYGIGFFSVFMIGNTVRVISRRCDYGDEHSRILEFRDGTTSRPMLIPASPGEAPIDGGTRVEILLKIAPFDKGGILYSGQADKPYKAKDLIASIAPCVDVEINLKVDDDVCSVITPGDWLSLSDDDLLSRISPQSNRIKRESSQRMHQDRLKKIYSADGNILGRACIMPGSYFTRTGGWITIGGLRASRLSHIQGILIGETLTISREQALPILKAEELARWATEQAELIHQANLSGNVKSKCSEVVLECGGALSNLPILCWGDEWLNSSEFRAKIENINELTVSFSESFNYDEDEDDVHPRDFNNSFKLKSEIIIVPNHKDSILRVGRQSWPNMITNKPYLNESNLEIEIRKIIELSWGDDVSESDDKRVVGTVDEVEISRNVTVFYRDDA